MIDIPMESLLDAYLVPFIHLYTARGIRTLSSLSLHPGQLPLLFVLSREEGLSMKALADRLHIKPPTVTVTVQRLERLGLVEKRADEEDQRACRLHLTPLGQKTLKEAFQLARENHLVATRGLSEEELQMMKHCFERMIENLQEDAGDCPLCSCPDASGKEDPCEDC